MSGSLLSIEKISKNFGGIVAVNRVSFTIRAGQIKGLIGPNGAGKTTLFNLISGVYRANDGAIHYNQKPLTGLAPYQISRHGIARTFQNVRLFTNLSVLDNIMVGAHTHFKTGWGSSALNLRRTIREEANQQEQAENLLEFVGLGEYSHYSAAALPFGKQRLLEIARALATGPQLLLLDEPAAGLNIAEKRALAELINQVRKLGITILLVEHDMNLVMKVCDEIVVLEFGSKIAEGDPITIRNDRKVIAAYLGEEVG